MSSVNNMGFSFLVNRIIKLSCCSGWPCLCKVSRTCWRSSAPLASSKVFGHFKGVILQPWDHHVPVDLGVMLFQTSNKWMNQSFLNAQIAVFWGENRVSIQSFPHNFDMHNFYPSLARRVTRRRLCLSNLVSLVQQIDAEWCKSQLKLKRHLHLQRKRCMLLISCRIYMNL